jgi:hypothetical protein
MEIVGHPASVAVIITADRKRTGDWLTLNEALAVLARHEGTLFRRLPELVESWALAEEAVAPPSAARPASTAPSASSRRRGRDLQPLPTEWLPE